MIHNIHIINNTERRKHQLGRRSSNCYVTPAREEIIERKYKLYIQFKSSNNFSEKRKERLNERCKKIKSVVVLLSMEKKKNIRKKPPFLLYDEEKPHLTSRPCIIYKQ